MIYSRATLVAQARAFVERYLERAPREHGFWVMLGAVTFAAFARYPSFFAGVTAVLLVAGAGWVGGLARARIRREERLQLGSAVALAASGVPIELAGGASLVDAAANAGAWIVVFSAFTLSVWACTARSSRVRRSAVTRWTLLALLIPLAAATVFAFVKLRAPALAALLAAASSVAFAIWRPGAKQMKAIGLSLAGTATFVALVLALV